MPLHDTCATAQRKANDMSKPLRIWLGLAILYAGILAWHQPLKGPLTEAEIRSAFGPRFDMLIESDAPQAVDLLNFFLSDDGRPFYMINLNAMPDQTPEVAQSARAYARYVLPRLLSRASYPVMSTDVIAGLNNAIGGDFGTFERLVVVRYRSRRDFLALISPEAFSDALSDKAASLDDWYAAPSAMNFRMSFPAAALVVLVLAGLLATSVSRRSRPSAL